MSNKKILRTIYLLGNNKYEFCPYCVLKYELDGKDYKEILRPLKKIITSERIDYGGGKVIDYIDEHFECPSCKSENINTNTFVRFYCCRADGTKYSEQPKSPALFYDAETRKMKEYDWDIQNRTWIKRA